MSDGPGRDATRRAPLIEETRWAPPLETADAPDTRDLRRRAAHGTTTAPTRLRGPIGFSALAHLVAIAAVIVWKPAPPPAMPPVYRVDLVAAPPGPRAEGIVDERPAPSGEDATGAATPPATPAPAVPTPPTPAPPAPSRAAPPRTTAQAPRTMPAPAAASAKPLPPRATPSVTPSAAKPAPAAPAPVKPAAPNPAAKPTATPAPAAKPTAAKPSASTTKPSPAAAATTAATRPGTKTGTAGATGPVAPRAGGGPQGGKGTDVANVSIRGLDFPYPGYLTNIVRQVALRFEPPNRSAALSVDVAFLIHRDGSVSNVRVVRKSSSYAFDLEARGAVEAAGAARAFGPLPEAFRDDVLPVTFTFDPSVIR